MLIFSYAQKESGSFHSLSILKEEKMKKEHINKIDILKKITPLIENAAVKLNLIPIEISFEKENNRWFLRIFIYKNNGLITHSDCENMTRALNLYLDELIDVKYYLEVSSPGLDRKLKSSREYVIFKGKKAKIKLKRLIDDSKEKVFDIRIGEYNGTDTLSVTRLSDNKQLDIKEEDILSIKLILELNRTGESAND